ncbi:Tn3 family transposase [Streptomyces exfoliatus]|uniref:Tn3 family transposase n=1 Tax=Streptomyces exfoliatus TaxID=1905 RepID=UPI0034E2394B
MRQLLEEGWEIDPEDLAHISPYLTEHVNRFGEYSTHELGIQPDAYDPETRRRLHPAARAGSARCQPWSGRLNVRSQELLLMCAGPTAEAAPEVIPWLRELIQRARLVYCWGSALVRWVWPVGSWQTANASGGGVGDRGACSVGWHRAFRCGSVGG